MERRNRLFGSILLLASLLLLANLPARADCTPGVMWGLDDTGFQDGYIAFATLGPQYGFSVYGCPAPNSWISGNLSRYHGWFSTCPSGGNYSQLVDYAGDADFPSQVNVASQLNNPFNNELQGQDTGFAYALDSNVVGPNVPQWVPLIDEGGPCGPIE